MLALVPAALLLVASLLCALLVKQPPRCHAFELEDQWWCPHVLRRLLTGVLASCWRFPCLGRRPADAVAAELMLGVRREADQMRILDLCSGSGGPVAVVLEALRKMRVTAHCTLTDLYPSHDVWERLVASSPEDIAFERAPVDATACQLDSGRFNLRTMFCSFHHFRPEQAERILANSVHARHGIAIVEMNDRSWLSLGWDPMMLCLLIPFLVPLAALERLCALPQATSGSGGRGRVLAALGWLRSTCVDILCIPFLQLMMVFDSAVSVLRTYSEEELLAMAARADPEQRFVWRYRTHVLPVLPVPRAFSGFAGFVVTSFVGYPRTD